MPRSPSKRQRRKHRTRRVHKVKQKTMKFLVFLRDKFVCQHCGFKPKKSEMKWQICSGDKKVQHFLTLDHIIPVSKGGKHVMENLMTLCNICNAAKADRLP